MYQLENKIIFSCSGSNYFKKSLSFLVNYIKYFCTHNNPIKPVSEMKPVLINFQRSLVKTKSISFGPALVYNKISKVRNKWLAHTRIIFFGVL